MLVSVAVVAAGAVLCWLVPRFYRAVEARLRTSTQARVASGDLSKVDVEATVQERLDDRIQVGLLLATFGMAMAAGCKAIATAFLPSLPGKQTNGYLSYITHVPFWDCFGWFFLFHPSHPSIRAPTPLQIGVYLFFIDAGSSYLLGAFAAGMAFSQLEHPARPGESRYGNFQSLSTSFAMFNF